MRFDPLVIAVAASLCVGAQAQEALPPIELTFLPPDYPQSDLCLQPPDEGEPGPYGDDSAELTDELRLRYLKSDAARLQREDARAYFGYINDLFTRRAAIDAEFAGPEEMLARIRLHVHAGRFDELNASGLVPALTAMSDQLSNAQRMALSHYHADGIGTMQDPALAQALIVEAAFGGHSRALLEIARMKRNGVFIEEWDAPLDLTVTMALGAMLGPATPGLCHRAEAIAREFLSGEIVRADPTSALAWRRFAADMGDAKAAWRVVEYHLAAPLGHRNDAELRRYLRRAIELGLMPEDRDIADLSASGAITPEELDRMFAYSRRPLARTEGGNIAPWLTLKIDLDAVQAAESGPYLEHLRELTAMPDAPGRVFLWLAREVSMHKGRWAGEPEVIALLEEAVRRDDPLAMVELSNRLLRYRDDPVSVNRAENLLLDALSRHGEAEAMERLDTLYRCQLNDAPRLAEADHWARAYRASAAGPLTIAANDLITLDRYRDPEAIAEIQRHALRGRSGAVAQQATRLLMAGIASEDVLRVWGDRLGDSNQSLEAFAELLFDLARTPAERDAAIAFFQRVYLNNGVTTALDLAIALTEHHGRSPKTVAQIEDLLTRASHRGEGAAIRLLARLQAPQRPIEEVFAEYAEDIDARGDFLALMFAIPFLPEDRVDDYIDRAVSLMNCGTKDADELGDAYAIRGDAKMSYHWRNVGLNFDGGHVLAKLRLSDAQMAMYGRGEAPGGAGLAARAQADGDVLADRRAFWLAANPALDGYDPDRAADILAAAFEAPHDRIWALGAWRRADPATRSALDGRTDLRDTADRAAETGNSAARYEYGMLLRETARDAADLAASVEWLRLAASAGHTDAMAELGFALAFGLGTERNDAEALEWLDRAAAKHNTRATDLAALVRVR